MTPPLVTAACRREEGEEEDEPEQRGGLWGSLVGLEGSGSLRTGSGIPRPGSKSQGRTYAVAQDPGSKDSLLGFTFCHCCLEILDFLSKEPSIFLLRWVPQIAQPALLPLMSRVPLASDFTSSILSFLICKMERWLHPLGGLF